MQKCFLVSGLFLMLVNIGCNAPTTNTELPETELPKTKDRATRTNSRLKPTLTEAKKGFQTNLVKTGEFGGAPDTPQGSAFGLIRFQSPAGRLAAYLTKDPGDGQKHPAIIWITGGDNNSIGDVWSPASRQNDQSASAFRKKGIVMMFPSQRGGNDNPGKREGFLGEVDDILAAADHLAKLPYVDKEQIYLGGHSTGGTKGKIVIPAKNRVKTH